MSENPELGSVLKRQPPPTHWRILLTDNEVLMTPLVVFTIKSYSCLDDRNIIKTGVQRNKVNEANIPPDTVGAIIPVHALS